MSRPSRRTSERSPENRHGAPKARPRTTLVTPDKTGDLPVGQDPLGAMLSVGALATLGTRSSRRLADGWTSTTVIGCGAVAVALGTLFAWWEVRNPEPMLQLSFSRKPAFSVASLGITLSYFGLMGAILAFTQYLQFARGFSAPKAGVIMLAPIPGLVAGGGNSDRITQRLGNPKVITGRDRVSGRRDRSRPRGPDRQAPPRRQPHHQARHRPAAARRGDRDGLSNGSTATPRQYRASQITGRS